MAKARTLLLAVLASIGGASVLLRLFLSLTRNNLDHSLAWRLIDFVSFFTNTTNTLVVLVAVASLVRPQSFLARPGVITATAIYILVVAVTYQWLLRGDPHGLALIANTGLHQADPILFIGYWLAFTPKGGLRWSQPLGWLFYPAAYIAWILARGAVVHAYPYFFADVDRLGYPRALSNGVLFMAVFYVSGLLAVAAGRLDRRRAPALA